MSWLSCLVCGAPSADSYKDIKPPAKRQSTTLEVHIEQHASVSEQKDSHNLKATLAYSTPSEGKTISASGISSQPSASQVDHPAVRQSFDVLKQAGLAVGGTQVAFTKPESLVTDVHELRYVGQGSQGVVYEGIWQGANVAVKWSIADQLDTGAYELLFSRLLSHPNVVQCYDTKVAVLNEEVFRRNEISTTSIALDSSQLNAQDDLGSGHHTMSTERHSEHHASNLQRSSYQSEEGFGDPMGRACSFTDVRDMLHVIGAKPGQSITQMIMEFCDQGSMLTAISRGIFLPISKFGPKVALRALFRTAKEVAQGMFHLHQASVIHGDLKPANVLLMNSRKDRRGFVAKVSDFGLAQYCPAAMGHVQDAPWGTLVFMAPERFRSNMLTQASDVWSFGVMLWQMYTAKLPYEGVRQSQLVYGITTNTLHLHWPEGTPESLVTLAKSCMAHSPTQRPTFQWLMHQLAVLENDVRLEGMRLSNSLDHQASSTLSSHVSGGLTASAPPTAFGSASGRSAVNYSSSTSVGVGTITSSSAALRAAGRRSSSNTPAYVPADSMPAQAAAQLRLPSGHHHHHHHGGSNAARLVQGITAINEGAATHSVPVGSQEVLHLGQPGSAAASGHMATASASHAALYSTSGGDSKLRLPDAATIVAATSSTTGRGPSSGPRTPAGKGELKVRASDPQVLHVSPVQLPQQQQHAVLEDGPKHHQHVTGSSGHSIQLSRAAAGGSSRGRADTLNRCAAATAVAAGPVPAALAAYTAAAAVLANYGGSAPIIQPCPAVAAAAPLHASPPVWKMTLAVAGATAASTVVPTAARMPAPAVAVASAAWKPAAATCTSTSPLQSRLSKSTHLFAGQQPQQVLVPANGHGAC